MHGADNFRELYEHFIVRLSGCYDGGWHSAAKNHLRSVKQEGCACSIRRYVQIHQRSYGWIPTLLPQRPSNIVLLTLNNGISSTLPGVKGLICAPGHLWDKPCPRKGTKLRSRFGRAIIRGSSIIV